MTEGHFQARDLYNQKDYAGAIDIITELLDDNPNDPAALHLLASVFISTGKRGLAYNICARAAKLAPDRSEVWCNFGRVQSDDEEGWRLAEECLNRSLEINPESTAALANMSSLKLQQCKAEEGLEWAKKSLEVDPNYNVGLSCLGFAHLYLGNWKEGFKYYHAMMGHESRPIIHYNDLPEWNGEEGTIIVNGEQGIGDELIYASFIPDISRTNKIVYDCMPRLKNLMQRSFDPNRVYVSGGRWSDEVEIPNDFIPEYRATQALLGYYCRDKDEDFDGEPYLKADQQIKASMRGLLDSISDKPKIGIAWTGGTRQSRCHFRQRTLEEFVPLIRDERAEFISLQYKDPSEEIARLKKNRNITVHHFPWITEEKNYDYTAALVSELDLVIAVPTSAVQLAGALGVESWVLVPKITGWLFHRDKYVWADSVKLFRDKPMKYITDQFNRWMKNDK